MPRHKKFFMSMREHVLRAHHAAVEEREPWRHEHAPSAADASTHAVSPVSIAANICAPLPPRPGHRRTGSRQVSGSITEGCFAIVAGMFREGERTRG